MEKNSTLYSNVPLNLSDKQNLGKNMFIPPVSPSDAVITNILAFSKALKIERSREAGLIEIILN